MNDRPSPRMERLVQAAELRDTGLIAGAVLRTVLARGESTLDRMHSPRGQRAKPSAGPALTTPVWPHAHQALFSAARGAVGRRPGLIARRFGCDAAALVAAGAGSEKRSHCASF